MTAPPATYPRSVVGLHWAIALLIVAAFPLGVYMHDLPLSPDKLRLFSYHKWIGITVLTLSLLRVVSRFAFAPPELPATMRHWERRAAFAMHVLLYALIFAVPISGWLMSSATGFQTVWFGVVPLPDLVSKSKELGQSFKLLHKSLNFVMLALLALHVAAALKHHFIERDAVLARMLPWRGRPRRC
jgi:cytochrome b561